MDDTTRQYSERPRTGRRRVLMIAPTSFFGDYGCHVRILEEARILRQLGHEVAIVTYHNGHDVAGVDIRRTPPIPWRYHYEVGSSRHKIAFDVLLGMTTVQTLLSWRPDVIHAHLHEGALIGRVASCLSRVPLVFDFQGSMTGEMTDHHFLRPDGWLYRPLLRLEGIIDRAADAIITSSGHATRLLREEFGCRPERVETVPDCVNADIFRPRPRDSAYYADRASLGLPPEAPVVAYLGLLAEYQGTPHLLQAAALLRERYPKVRYLIMGYPAVDTYREMAVRLGIADRVVFTGRVPYEEAPRWLGLGDIGVAPKLSATEGCGKILDYMAMALPTVAFDTAIGREYLGELGIYARERTPESLAGALATALELGSQAAVLGARLRARVIRDYTWTRAGRAILAVYDRVRGVPARVPAAQPYAKRLPRRS